jgi:peptide/nickel transport system substrate-binding protein
MGKLSRRTLALLLAVLCMSVVAACGDDDDDGGDGGGGGTGEAKSGGSITISQTSQPDFLDPALSYTVNGIEPMWLVYTPLITYPRTGDIEKDSSLIPGLAEEMPTISKDGKTYELTLRKGLKYSDGSAVKAEDFEHTIRRVLNLESGGSAFYLGIEGAQDYVDAGKPQGDISGIETNNQTGKITINLTAPDGSFSHVLSMWFAGLVPSDTPIRNMTEDPPPGVGPYKITESVPNRQFVM